MGLLHCDLGSPLFLATQLACVMTFFLEWSVEAKFFFIFGCLIGIVIPMAGVVRKRKTCKTQQLSRLGDHERAERGELRQVIVFEEEIPFGIQAMEDDLEVDGLWNSKTSTPLHTPLPSPIISGRELGPIRSALFKVSHSRRTSSTSSVSKLDLYESPPEASPRVHISGERASAGRSVSESAHTFRNVRKASSDPVQCHQFVRRRSVSSPHCSTREHRVCPTVSKMSTTQTTQGTPSTTSPKRSRTYVIGGIASPRTCDYTTQKAMSSRQDVEVLDRMEAHRGFHAAESGQLLPRTKQLFDLTQSPSTLSSVDCSADEDCHNSRSITWPIASPREVIRSMTVPQMKPQRVISPPITPFRAFVEMHPPPKMCPSAWTDRTQDLVSEKLQARRKANSITISASTHSRSSSTTSTTTASESSPTSDDFPLCHKTSRKVNEGFEVIPANTHGKLSPVEKSVKQYKWPLESKHDMRKPRKLQKRYRPRSSSDNISESTTYHKDTFHAVPAGLTY